MHPPYVCTERQCLPPTYYVSVRGVLRTPSNKISLYDPYSVYVTLFNTFWIIYMVNRKRKPIRTNKIRTNIIRTNKIGINSFSKLQQGFLNQGTLEKHKYLTEKNVRARFLVYTFISIMCNVCHPHVMSGHGHMTDPLTEYAKIALYGPTVCG